MLILGLDISTAVTAYSLINTEQPQNDFVVKYDGIYLNKKKSLYEKSKYIKEVFQDIKKSHTVDIVFAEESLQSFRRGLSSAKTLSTLTRFNGIVCYLAQDIFEKEVNLVNVLHARSKLGIKICRKSDVTTKDQVLKWAMNQPSLKGVQWPTKILKSGPRAGQEIHDPSCYDIADASVMSLYGEEFIKSLSCTFRQNSLNFFHA